MLMLTLDADDGALLIDAAYAALPLMLLILMPAADECC